MERSLMLRNVHDLGANRGDIVHEATITCPACGSRRGYDFGLLAAFASIALLAQPMVPLPSTTTSQD